ncbi:uncharacterized protein LOC144662832 [Oculina patagonica]
MSSFFEVTAWTLTITTLLGNCFLILIIVSRKRLRSSKLNWFIISLAVADVLVALSFYPPLFFCDRWFPCQSTFMRAFRWIFIYSSVCNLCAMIMDRYVAITSPFYHRTKVSGKTVVIWITFSWLVPVVLRGLIFIPFYFFYKRETLKYALPILLVLFEALPCVLILFVALRISIIAKRQQLKHRNQQQQAARGNMNRENRRGSTALKMILFVAFFFIFCYSLELYYAMCKHVLKLCEDTEILQMIRRLLLIANSAINPFAYAFLKRDIKVEVKKACLFCRKGNSEVNVQSSSETNFQAVSLVSVLDTRL